MRRGLSPIAGFSAFDPFGLNGGGGAPAALPPENTVAPAITGDALQGSTLTCSTGTWSQSEGGGAISYGYQWTRAGVDISGATASTYATVADDVGEAVGCKVTATDANGASDPATASGAVTVESVADAVEAALSGSAGMALDFSDLTRMWTTSTKTTLVASASDPIGAIRSKWGAAEYDIVQATAGQRPTWNGSVAAGFVSGSLQHLSAIAAAALLQNKPAGFACGRFVFGNLTVPKVIFALSTGSATSRRFHLIANSNGSLTIAIRRVDGGSATAATSAAGVVTTATPYVITMTCDYNGTRAISVRVNGVEVISTTLVEAAGLVSNTASGSFFVGRMVGTADYFDGRISRMVFADKLMTAGERAAIEAWVGEGSLS